jgi:hypothetical protein
MNSDQLKSVNLVVDESGSMGYSRGKRELSRKINIDVWIGVQLSVLAESSEFSISISRPLTLCSSFQDFCMCCKI